jgi:hypothetical protein
MADIPLHDEAQAIRNQLQLTFLESAIFTRIAAVFLDLMASLNRPKMVVILRLREESFLLAPR